MTVEFGNDGTWEDERRVSLEEYEANFNLIRTKVTEASNGRLVVLPFTPIVDPWNQFYDKEFFKQQGGLDVFAERYREVTRAFARRHGLPLADIDRALRREMAAQGTESCILPDGVHLTGRGNQVVAKTVFDVLVTEIGALGGS